MNTLLWVIITISLCMLYAINPVLAIFFIATATFSTVVTIGILNIAEQVQVRSTKTGNPWYAPDPFSRRTQ